MNKFCRMIGVIRTGLQYARRNGWRRTMVKAWRKYELERAYREWQKGQRLSEAQLEQQRRTVFAYEPLVSIVVPVYNTPVSYLQAMLQSVLAQTYGNWELCIANGSSEPEPGDLLGAYQARETRIRVKQLPDNLGIAGNSNAALDMAQGDYAALLDHDDLLAPDALYEMVSRMNDGDVPDFLYSDEDKTDADGQRFFSPNFKPDFAPDTLRNHNYICHFTVIRRALLEQGGIRFSAEYDGAQDYDVILRAVELAGRICHIPRVLYHWRVHSASTAGGGGAAKPYTHEAGRRALQAHLQRCSLPGEVLDGFAGRIANFYRVRYAVTGCPSVSVLAGFRMKDDGARQCLQELRETMGDFLKEILWSDSGADACLQAAGEYLLFVREPLRFVSSDWCRELLGVCQREDVGAVGAKILSPSGRIAGTWLYPARDRGFWQGWQGCLSEEDGYGLRLRSIQNVGALPGFCLMVRKAVFQEAGGFSPELSGELQAVDFCQRLQQLGKLLVFDPYAEGILFSEYREQASAGEELFRLRWGAQVQDGFDHPAFSRKSSQCVLERLK